MLLQKDGYSQFRLRLIAGFIGLIVFLTMVMGWKIYSSYESDRLAARSQVQSFARAMGAHVQNRVQAVDFALRQAGAEIARLDSSKPLSRGALQKLMAATSGGNDSAYWLIFIDASGKGVAASNKLPIEGVDYRQRDYFHHHLAPGNTGLFIGEPSLGKISKRAVFFMSRKVIGSQGETLGVIAAPVDAQEFAKVFESARFTPDLSVTFAHIETGKVIARVPLFEKSFASSIARSPLMEMIKAAPSGIYESTSVVAGDKRVFFYEKQPGLPLAVAVGISQSSWTAALWEDVTVAAISLGIIVGVMFWSGRFALKSYGRLETSRARQRALNEKMQDTEAALLKSEKMVRDITNNLPALISYVGQDQRYIFHNASYNQISGIDYEGMIGSTIENALGAEHYKKIKPYVERALSGERLSFEMESDLIPGQRYYQYEYIPNFGVNGDVLGFYGMVMDITERKQSEQLLERLARVDTLTGMPNRNQIYERLEQGLDRSRRSRGGLGCLYLDIDHFKAINDTYGHGAGDELLRQFGERVSSCVRKTDLAGRLAGDEFIVVLEGLERLDDATTVAQKIIDEMAEPFHLSGVSVNVSTSIGVGLSTDTADTPDELLKRADCALYEAKRAGRGTFK